MLAAKPRIRRVSRSKQSSSLRASKNDASRDANSCTVNCTGANDPIYLKVHAVDVNGGASYLHRAGGRRVDLPQAGEYAIHLGAGRRDSWRFLEERGAPRLLCREL